MAYLEINLHIDPKDRAAAAGVYAKYKPPFLADVPGARSKELLVRTEDVQVLHGFDSVTHANEYLTSCLFTDEWSANSNLCCRRTRTSASSTLPDGRRMTARPAWRPKANFRSGLTRGRHAAPPPIETLDPRTLCVPASLPRRLPFQ